MPRFSNPRQTYDGDALGVTDWFAARNRGGFGGGPADAVRSLNRTRHAVSRFRRRGLSTEQRERYDDTWQVQVLETGTATTGTASRSASFIDHPIGAGTTPVKALHFRELRAQVGALRAREGLSAVQWTDPTLVTGATPVKRIHMTKLRVALDDVYAAAGRPAPGYTDATVTAGVTPIRAVHVEELRAAVSAVSTSSGTTAGAVSRSPQVDRAAAGTGAGDSEQQIGDVFEAVDARATVVEPRPQGTGTVGFEPLALRRRLVEIDGEALAREAFELDGSAGVPPRLVLNLFDDVVVTGIVEQRERAFSGAFALSGGIEGTELGMMTLVVNGPVVVGTVWTPGGIYWIEPAGGGLHWATRDQPTESGGDDSRTAASDRRRKCDDRYRFAWRGRLEVTGQWRRRGASGPSLRPREWRQERPASRQLRSMELGTGSRRWL